MVLAQTDPQDMYLREFFLWFFFFFISSGVAVTFNEFFLCTFCKYTHEIIAMPARATNALILVRFGQLVVL